jgi:hypothetical protein
MTIWVAGAHAYVQMVSVVKMATMLEEYATEDQRSVVRSMSAKGLNAKDVQ